MYRSDPTSVAMKIILFVLAVVFSSQYIKNLNFGFPSFDFKFPSFSKKADSIKTPEPPPYRGRSDFVSEDLVEWESKNCGDKSRGYDWAAAHAIENPINCRCENDAFYHGCVEYAQKQKSLSTGMTNLSK